MFATVWAMSQHDHSSNDFTHSVDAQNVHITVQRVPESDAEIVLRFEQSVRRYCRSRTRSEADADDAVQDTFLRFLRRSERRIRSNEGWLITAAARACANINDRHRRDEQRRSELTVWDGCFSRHDDERLSDRGANDPERITTEHLTISALLRGLKPRERIVLTHLYLLGANSEQLARYLNVTPNNLRQIAFNARRHARALLQERKDTDSAIP